MYEITHNSKYGILFDGVRATLEEARQFCETLRRQDIERGQTPRLYKVTFSR